MPPLVVVDRLVTMTGTHRLQNSHMTAAAMAKAIGVTSVARTCRAYNPAPRRLH